jgi:hypothetical protein
MTAKIRKGLPATKQLFTTRLAKTNKLLVFQINNHSLDNRLVNVSAKAFSISNVYTIPYDSLTQ